MSNLYNGQNSNLELLTHLLNLNLIKEKHKILDKDLFTNMKIFVKLDVKDFTNIHFLPMPLNLL